MKLVGNSRAIRSPEFHKKKQRERIFRISIIAIVALLLLVAPVLALRHEKLLISEVQVSGNGATRSEEIAAIAQEELEGKYLWIIPKRSTLFAPKSRIEERLLESIPRLSMAEATLHERNTLKIEVAERKPFALYCEDILDVSNPSKCFFLDNSGNIFSEAPDFSGTVYMIYSSVPVLETPLRSQLIEPEEFEEISKFITEMPRLNIDSRALVKRGNEYALLMESGTELKWKSGQDLNALISDLESFLRDSKIKQTAFGNLLYIDLRFDNKVFYKFRNE